MDGIHDLGGKLGYGAVDVNEPEQPFHNDYDGRMWAISRTARPTGIGIDWWRHVRELIARDDYLNRSYFDSWAQTEMAALVDAGVCTLEELLDGCKASGDMPQALTYVEILAENARKAANFGRPVSTKPLFSVGANVVTDMQGHRGHTRLPEYARGKPGRVIKHHGGHVFPDAAARGEEVAGHLYTVAFCARDLWGADANTLDEVMLELWEDYLAPA